MRHPRHPHARPHEGAPIQCTTQPDSNFPRMSHTANLRRTIYTQTWAILATAGRSDGEDTYEGYSSTTATQQSPIGLFGFGFWFRNPE